MKKIHTPDTEKLSNLPAKKFNLPSNTFVSFWFDGFSISKLGFNTLLIYLRKTICNFNIILY